MLGQTRQLVMIGEGKWIRSTRTLGTPGRLLQRVHVERRAVVGVANSVKCVIEQILPAAGPK
jgi:hypothetical protein